MAHNPGFLKLVNDAKAQVKETDVSGYKEMLARGETPVLVDTREDNEFAAGHVKGAVHLSRGIIERDIETIYPDKSTPFVLYCGGGFRSALVARRKSAENGLYERNFIRRWLESSKGLRAAFGIASQSIRHYAVNPTEPRL